MKVPDAIQKQADKAEALQKELATGTPVEIINDPPQVVNVNPDEYVNATPDPQPVNVVEPQQQAPGEQTWEHKYNVLQGKFNSELTELRSEIESQAGTIANLNSLIVSLNNRPAASTFDTEPRQAEPQTGQADIDPEEFAGYGAEMIDLVKMVKSQSDQIAMLKGETDTLAERQVKSEGDEYFDALDRTVADWRSLNKAPQFLEWLKEPDGLSGISRQSNMTAAHNALDFATVAKYFLAFKANGNQTPNLQPNTPTPPAQQPLASQVVPVDTGVRTEITQPGDNKSVIVTRDQFNRAVSDNIQKRITDEQFKVISDNFQRSIAGGQI